MIRLRLWSRLREIAGSKEVLVAGNGAPIQHVLERFADRLGDEARRALFREDGELRPGVTLLMNGSPAGNGPATEVRSGDVVSVLLPTAGE